LMCTYFVPLHPGDSLSTPATVNGTWPPSLDLLQPDEYRLRLVYVSESRPKEEQCATGSVPIWTGRTESPWVQFKAVQE
jgi:hypothetical protein